MKHSFSPIDRYISNNVTNFAFEMTQQCNFRCKYCCFSGQYKGMRIHSNKSMSHETLIDAINYVRSHAKKYSPIFLSFFGGEALLRKDEIDYAIKVLSGFYGERISFDLSTNGFLLTDSVVDWICSFDRLNISVSIDGCKVVHDRNRKLINGCDTFDYIYNNLTRFKQRFPLQYNDKVRLLLTIGSLKDVELIGESFSSLKPLIGANKLFVSHIIPNFEQNNMYRDSFEEKYQFCKKALEHYRNGVTDIYTILLEELLKKTMFKANLNNYKSISLGTCLDEMYSTYISTDGQIYACEKFCENQFIGNIWQGIDANLARKMSIKYSLRKSVLCGNCSVIEYCNRCLTDLKYSTKEMRFICQDIKENIELSLYCQSEMKKTN